MTVLSPFDVQVSDDVEGLVQWLRYAEVETVLKEAVAKLQADVPEDDLWAATGIAACRYVNNQAHNLLGFVSHAMIGCEDARRLAQGQRTRTRYLLLLQSIHQTVLDIHDPCFAPFELVPYWPLHEATVEENIAWMRRDVRDGEYMRADHRFVGLAETLSQAELIDLMLDTGLEGMVTDDHTIISPALSLGMLELTGWDAGFDMLRWAIRYSASFPRNFGPYDRARALRRTYGLENGPATLAFQPARVEPLRHALYAADPVDRPEIAIRAMAQDGISPDTILAAAARAACDMYLCVDPTPHQDFDAVSREVAPIHIGNCLKTLRSALRYMSPATQVLAAIQAGSQVERGPSVLSADFEFIPFVPAPAYPYAEDVARLRSTSPGQLLELLPDLLHDHDCRSSTAAVRVYADAQADAESLIAVLTEVACTDNGTLMHNIKHLNSMTGEFRRSDSPDRWNFLIQATKFISWYAGLTTDGHERAAAALERFGRS
jgi:hypothetical protein